MSNRIFKQFFNSLWWRRIFCLVEAVFSYLIFFFFLQLVTFVEISGNKGIKKGIFHQVDFFLFRASFLQIETVTDTS